MIAQYYVLYRVLVQIVTFSKPQASDLVVGLLNRPKVSLSYSKPPVQSGEPSLNEINTLAHLVHTGLQFLVSRSCFGVAVQLDLAIGVKGALYSMNMERTSWIEVAFYT